MAECSLQTLSTKSLVKLEIGHLTLVAEKRKDGYRADRYLLERATNRAFEGNHVHFNGDFDETPWPYPNWPLDILPENLRLARAYPPMLRDFPEHLAINFRYVHILDDIIVDPSVPGSHLEAEVWSVDPDTHIVSKCVYELDRLKIPVLNDAFTSDHAEADIKREVNQVFAEAVEPATPTIVLDCPKMGTTRTLLDFGNTAPIFIVNPLARGANNPEGFESDDPDVSMVPLVFHHALQCFDFPQSNLALDYCCTFSGDVNKCMPFEDVRSALAMRQLEPNGGVLWVTYSLRGVRKEDFRDPIFLIEQWGSDYGYQLTSFYEKMYGKIVAVMFKSFYCDEVVSIEVRKKRRAVEVEVPGEVEVPEMDIPVNLEEENARLRRENKRLRKAIRHLVKL